MNTIRIGPDSKVPKIKNKIESVSLMPLFVNSVNPTTTGRIVISKRKSYLSKGPNVASPMKNFDASICITFGYIVSPEKMTMAEIPMIPVYEIKRRIFFLVEIDVLPAKNNVITK
ncbi:MAG: hypothetical protein CL686_00235 [Candidatus Nitrosopelagicus sp.]|nr:hypothetical protein [Candidatus Nitrosopelagicus sp.]